MKWFICDYVDCFHGYHCIDTGITLLLMSCQLKWQYNAIVIMMQQTGLSVKTKSLILDDIFHVDICELWVGGLSYSIIQMMMLVLFHFCNSCRFTNTLNTHEEIQQEAHYHNDNGNKISPLWWWLYFKLSAVLTVNPLSMRPFPCNDASRFVCSQQQKSSFLASRTCCNATQYISSFIIYKKSGLKTGRESKLSEKWK